MILLVLFPQGGSEPFVASAFWPALAGAVLSPRCCRRDERTLRDRRLLYALALVAAFAIATPLGGNATRLGALAAGPIVLGALAAAPPAARRRARAGVRLLAAVSGRARRRAGQRRPVAAGLLPRAAGRLPAGRRAPPGSFRVEIPFTENHWEARHVAARRSRSHAAGSASSTAASARSSTTAASTPRRYRAWLDERAVAYVALPDVALDDAGRDEARLVAAGLPYLREVWRDRHWRVFAVARPAALASSGARGGGASATLSAGGVTLARRARRQRARARALHALVAGHARARLRTPRRTAG